MTSRPPHALRPWQRSQGRDPYGPAARRAHPRCAHGKRLAQTPAQSLKGSSGLTRFSGFRLSSKTRQSTSATTSSSTSALCLKDRQTCGRTSPWCASVDVCSAASRRRSHSSRAQRACRACTPSSSSSSKTSARTARASSRCPKRPTRPISSPTPNPTAPRPTISSRPSWDPTTLSRSVPASPRCAASIIATSSTSG